MKMNELFTARYSNGKTAYEKTLDWIYSHQGDARVAITPTIWLWKSSRSDIFFVDYVGDGIGCTLSTFDTFADAQRYQSEIGEMTTYDFEDWLINKKWKR